MISFQAEFIAASCAAVVGVYHQLANGDSIKFRSYFAFWHAMIYRVLCCLTLILIPLAVTGLFSKPLAALFGLTLQCLIIFCIVYMFTTILPQMRSSLKFVRYEKYGLLEHWSRITREFNSEEGWINRFSVHCAEAIKSAIPSGAPYIRIASPTANYGDYEVVIAAAAAARCGAPVHMLASDIATTPHVSDFEYDNVIYRYRENVNAWQLADVLAGRVHALLDLKGMLWHELNSLIGLKKKAEKVLLHYYDLLEPDGIVVIDAAYKGKRETLHVMMNSVWMQLAKKIYWYAESSTYRKMRGIYKRSKVLQEHFDEVFIDDGLYSLAYHKRKEVV